MTAFFDRLYSIGYKVYCLKEKRFEPLVELVTKIVFPELKNQMNKHKQLIKNVTGKPVETFYFEEWIKKPIVKAKKRIYGEKMLPFLYVDEIHSVLDHKNEIHGILYTKEMYTLVSIAYNLINGKEYVTKSMLRKLPKTWKNRLIKILKKMKIKIL